MINPWSSGFSSGWVPSWVPATIAAAARTQYDLAVIEQDFVPSGSGNRTEGLTLSELMLCVGLSTSPAQSHTLPNPWGFLVEHWDSFATTSGRLRVVDSASGWDTHVKGAFSDRLAMGATAWALWKHYGVVHLADAGPFIGSALASAPLAYRNKALTCLGIYGKSGKYKPDFFCLDHAGNVVIAEAKGAVGPPSSLTTEKKKGKEQVRNVTPVGATRRASNSDLVFALNVRRLGETVRTGKDSTLTVVDPEPNASGLEVPVTAEELVRHAYSKVLVFGGHRRVADAVVRGSQAVLEVSQVERSIVEIGGQRALPLFFAGDIAFGLHAKVATALLTTAADGFVRAIHEATGAIARPESTREAGLWLPNGVIMGPVS